MSKDMFDWLEEDFDCNREFAFLIKHRRNKMNRSHTLIYLSDINNDGDLIFRRGLELAKPLIPMFGNDYEYIKNKVRLENIHCSIYRMTKIQFHSLARYTIKPVREVGWWGRFKVWFSRKVHSFTVWILKIKKE